MKDALGEPISYLDILREDGREWIVLYHDPYFPSHYPGWYLMYRNANVLAIGDRLPIRYGARMQRTGEQFDASRLNMRNVTEPPTRLVPAEPNASQPDA